MCYIFAVPALVLQLSKNMKVYLAFFFIFLGFYVAEVSAMTPESPYVSEVDGYINDARRENPDVGQPLELMPIPIAVRTQKLFKDKVVNQALSDEFQRKYEDEFKRSRAEADFHAENQFGTFDSSTGQWVDVREETEREAAFGTFMYRRVFEYHIENYAKSDPELKEAYEFKEKVTNYEVSVAPGYSFKSKYSIAGNHFEASLVNPHIGNSVRLEMDPANFGPTAIRRTQFSLDRSVSSRVTVEAHYILEDDFYQLTARMPF